MPGRYLKFEVARRPSTSRTGADRVQPTFIRAPFDEEVHRSAPGQRRAGDRRRPLRCSILLNTFFGVRIVYICSKTVLLKNLSTRVHSFNEKIYINGPEKGVLEDTVAAGYCGSSNVEPGGGDVAFGEALEDAP